MASTDLSDLGAMVAAANRQDCGALGCFPRASGPAAPSLLLAVPIEIPCNTVTGIDAAMTRSAAADGVAEVTITAHSRPRSCGDAGALSLPPPLASLVAIPVSGLPASELVVHLQHDGASPRELGGAVVYGETVVDLRPPPTPMPAPAVRKAQALAAIAFAEDDAKRRVPEATDKPVLVLLGTTRWAGPDLDCEGKPARHGTAFAGYVVMVQLEGHLLEYHSARGATRYCGGKELPGHQMGGTTGGMGDGM